MKKLIIYGICIMMCLLLCGCSAANRHYRSAKKCFLSGNYEEAAANFSEAIEINPNRADYYLDYGMALVALKRYDEAIEQFDYVYRDKDILMIRRNNQRALRGKGLAYYQRQEYEEALLQFDAALAIGVLSELNMDILYYKGNALLITGAYEEAEETYSRIIDTFGSSAEAYSKRAYTYLKVGDYDQSLADYEEAIRLAPNNYEYYFGKYDLMLARRDDAGAAMVLEQAAAITAKSKEDRYNQARIHYFQENYELALAEFSEGFAQGFPGAYFYIGEIYAKQKDYATAIYYYEKYMEKGAIAETAVYNQVAYCYMKQNNYAKALEFLDLGIKVGDAGTMRVLKKNKIIAQEYMGYFDTALETLRDYRLSYPKEEQAAKEEIFLFTRNFEESIAEE